jgi:hypothetical protein
MGIYDPITFDLKGENLKQSWQELITLKTVMTYYALLHFFCSKFADQVIVCIANGI